jgi:hypothetical protein
MDGMNIRLQIWLSVSIFILGYLLSTVAEQFARLRSEEDLRAVSNVLVPAANNAQSARHAFTRLADEYAGGVPLQTRSGPQPVASDADRTLQCLSAIAHLPGMATERSSTALRLASDVRRFLEQSSITDAQVSEPGSAQHLKTEKD